jgi:aminoglycoside/choline kinase family phosphotransferase
LRRYPGTLVTELAHAERKPGFATKLKLELTYNPAGRDHGLPRYLWLKGGFSEANRLNIEAYVAEAMFFAFWGSDVEINKPRSYYEGLDRSGLQGLVLLEDLNQRGARFGCTTRPLSPITAAQILRLQARYHARWWMSPQLSHLRTYVSRFAAPTFLIRRLIDPTLWRTAVEKPRGKSVPKALKNPATLLRAYEALWALAPAGPQTFIHGDPHVGNYFFEKDGAPGAADWQAYVAGPALHDVSYFLCGALEVEDRRRHETDLLRLYLAELATAGVIRPPSFDEAWRLHRCFALHGLSRVAALADQGPDVTDVYAERYGIACADLQTAQALGVT